MPRSARQLKLIEIINNNNVETQTELTELLIDAGFAVTQATISRDIKELGITKVLTPQHKYKYVYKHEEQVLVNRFNNLFKQSVISLKIAQNIVVIKTIVGSANSAAAFLDNLELDEIVGTIAGDDTIMIVSESNESALHLVEKLNSYLD